MFTGLKWAGWIFCVAVMTALCVGPSPQTAFAQDKVRDDAPAARRERPFRGDKDRPRFDRPQRDRRDHDPLPLTQEQIEQWLEIMRQLHPKFAERIEAALEENPEMAKRMLEKAGRRLARFQHMRETDPQAFELEVQDRTLERESHELHRELQNPEVRNDPEKAAQLRDEIRRIVTEHFEVRHKKREHELAKLEQRIKELRDQLKQRSEKKDQIIERRYKDLTGQAEGSSW